MLAYREALPQASLARRACPALYCSCLHNVLIYILREDVSPLVQARQAKLEGLVHPVQYGGVQVPWSVGGQHHRKVT